MAQPPQAAYPLQHHPRGMTQPLIVTQLRAKQAETERQVEALRPASPPPVPTVSTSSAPSACSIRARRRSTLHGPSRRLQRPCSAATCSRRAGAPPWRSDEPLDTPQPARHVIVEQGWDSQDHRLCSSVASRIGASLARLEKRARSSPWGRRARRWCGDTPLNAAAGSGTARGRTSGIWRGREGHEGRQRASGGVPARAALERSRNPRPEGIERTSCDGRRHVRRGGGAQVRQHDAAHRMRALVPVDAAVRAVGGELPEHVDQGGLGPETVGGARAGVRRVPLAPRRQTHMMSSQWAYSLSQEDGMKPGIRSVAYALMCMGLSVPASAATYTSHKVVNHGKEVLVIFFYSINPDCSSRGSASVAVGPPPQGGTVTSIHARDFPYFAPENPRSVCNKRRVEGERILYRANPGFVGTDSFVVQIVNANGDLSVVNTQIDVR